MPKRLTDLAIEKMKAPSTKRVFVGDAIYKGLYLVLQPSGKKTWLVARRLDGKLVKVKIGSFPAFSVEQARQEATKYLQAFDKKEDPREIKRTEETAKQSARAETVAVVSAEWLKRDQADKRTLAEVTRFVNNRLIPAWGERPISSITKKDCIAFINKIADEASPVRSRRIYCCLHRVFQWCLEQDILTHHPMSGMKKLGQENRRRRFLSDLEIKLFWEATEKECHQFKPIFRLLLLTGCRREEIGGLRWCEVKGNYIELPGDRTKRLPQHKDKGRVIPLSDSAQAILEDLKAHRTAANMDFIFSSTGYSGASGWGRAKNRVDAYLKAGLAQQGLAFTEYRLHDLRRTLASGLQKMRIQTEAIELLLGHLETSGSRSGIIGVYQTADFSEEAQQAAQVWADHVAQLVKGISKPKVLSLPIGA